MLLVAVSGVFDGLAHEPRRHGVRWCGALMDGQSEGAPGGFLGSVQRWLSGSLWA
jgi:hypothetical protein